jgi:hypothetical protein
LARSGADPQIVAVAACRVGLGERGAQWTEVISWEPRAFVYHNFLVDFSSVSSSTFYESHETEMEMD